MKISTISIRKPVTTSVTYIAIALVGIYAFMKIGVDLLPNVAIPHLLVQTAYPNATAEEVEKQITEPLESAAITVTGVKKVTSVSKEGISLISIDFNWGTDMKFAILSLREKLDNMSFALPKESGRPTIIRLDPASSPIMTLVLSYRNQFNNNVNNIKYIDHDSAPQDIQRFVDLKEASRLIFKRRFEQIDGVSRAVLTGGLEKEILIQIDPLKLTSLNISLNEISVALRNSNINMPAGSIMNGLFRFSLKTSGEFLNIKDIENTVVRKNNNGSLIHLNDIATISENFKEREGLTRFNGSEAVGLLIYKQPDANTTSIANLIKETIASLKRNYPDYDLLVVSDQSNFIENAISNVKQEIYYGGILAVIVLFFFLSNLRHVIIIGITIPTSLVITFLLLYLFNINFNIISLGGIAVGVGMLLDNAIIVIENNMRYKEQGLSNRLAVIKGTEEVAMPIVASTLTTIAVFLPLIFVHGIVAELFRDESLAIAFSLVSSILTALTLIPMLDSRESYKLLNNPEKFICEFKVNDGSSTKKKKSIYFFIFFPVQFIYKKLLYLAVLMYLNISLFLKKKFLIFFKAVDKAMEYLIEKYEWLLEWSLNNRKKVIFITLSLLIITFIALINMKKEFIPKGAQDEFVIDIEYPSGTSLRGNALLTSTIENTILSIPNVKAVVSNIGRVNEFDFLNKEQITVNRSNLIIKLNSYENYYDVQNQVRKVLANMTGIKYSFKETKNSYSMLINPSENDIVIKIKNKDLDKSFSEASFLYNKIKNQNFEEVKELRIGIEKNTPEYTISINREKCLAFNVDMNSIADQLSDLVKGKVVTYFSNFDKKIDIKIKATDEYRSDFNKLLDLDISSQGKNIKLKNLIDYQFKYNFNEIWHEDQSRVVYLYASLYNGKIDETISKIHSVVKELPKSQDELITVGGVNEEINLAFSSLYIALIISVVLMYVVLASEFESLLFPFIILFSVPLGLIGGILLLFIFGESISVISIMGLIILVGIADNDAVVKVEFIIRKRKEGLSVHDAIVEAGKDRFRPIVMNSFTVIFGLIPMMIGIGAATQLRVSLSLAVVGGLISSTFLTLTVIPVLYTFFERFSISDTLLRNNSNGDLDEK